MTDVEITVEVLGKKLSRAEAEALYYELQRELKMEPVTITYPVPVPSYPTWPYQPVYGTYPNTCGLTPALESH